MWVVAAWAAIIAIWDLRQRRVPNLALLPALLLLVAGFALDGRTPFGADWRSSLAGGLIATLLLLPGYALRKLGAGDVKMAALLGAFAGWAATIEILLFAGLTLGLMAFGAAMAGKREARLPAAVALAAGLYIEWWLGPVWIGSGIVRGWTA